LTGSATVRMLSGRAFQVAGPACENARSPNFWSEVQTCIWPSWCHCHSLSLASEKSRLVLSFWYRLTRIVPEKRAVKRVCVRVCVCVLSAYTAIQHIQNFTNYCCRLLISLDFCFKACALCVHFVQKHRLQAVHATVFWHCQSAADQSSPIRCYYFYKNVIITSLHKDYLTDSLKVKLSSVYIFTYGCSLKVS